MERKLPLYFVISGSSKMGRKSFEAIWNGMNTIRNAIMSDPYAIETVHICVIQVCSDAWSQQLLTPAFSWRPSLIFPEDTNELVLGAAFRILDHRISQDVVSPSKNFRGDFCPLIILMLNSPPTDEWIRIASSVLNRSHPPIASCVTLLLGSNVSFSDFIEVPELCPINIADALPVFWVPFFRWVDQPTWRA